MNVVDVKFTDDFHGVIQTANASLITVGADAVHPYDMLLGALVSCLHATFLEIIVKKRVTISGASYHVAGKKRQEIPTTLEKVNLNVTFYGVKNRTAVEKSLQLATKYCSVYATVSQVAEIEVQMNFAE